MMSIFLLRELLQDREHQLLLAHGAGVFDFLFFGEGEEFDRGFDFEVLKFHFPHWGGSCCMEFACPSTGNLKEGRIGKREGWVVRFLKSGLGHYGIWSPGPDACATRLHENARLLGIRLRSVGYAKHTEQKAISQEADDDERVLPVRSERFHDHQDHDEDHQDGRYLVDYPVEFLAALVPVGGEILNRAGQKSVQSGEHDDQCEFGVKPAGAEKCRCRRRATGRAARSPSSPD